MMGSQNKDTGMQTLGFWQLFAIVLGSQIGSGVFMLPTSLSVYGWYGMAGWLVAGLGALSLSLVFSELVARVQKTGGPYVFVEHGFQSPLLSFLTGWVYWLISAMSTVTVIASAVGALSPFLPWVGYPWVSAVYQIAFLLVFLAINLRGFGVAGGLEVVLMVIKIVTLIVVPAFALGYFQAQHFYLHSSLAHESAASLVARPSLLAFWAFIGLETATAPAESVKDASTTIPKALILGTLCVMLLYMFNCLGIQGLFSQDALMHATVPPYVLAVQTLLPGSAYLVFSLVAAAVFLSNLNAWLLTSGQVAYGFAKGGYLPAFMKAPNAYGAPVWALVISSGVMVPLILASVDGSIAKQVESVIEMSLMAFMCVYIACAVSFLNTLRHEGAIWRHPITYVTYASLMFLAFIFSSSSMPALALTLVLAASGLPVYFFWYKKQSYYRKS